MTRLMEDAPLEMGHELRRRISACLEFADKMAKAIDCGAGGRELALAITKLQEGKMWVGKACGELGGTLPEGYPHDEAPAPAIA